MKCIEKTLSIKVSPSRSQQGDVNLKSIWPNGDIEMAMIVYETVSRDLGFSYFILHFRSQDWPLQKRVMVQ
jgi:hypothetical protein